MFYFKVYQERVTNFERKVCYAIMAYGIIGGSIAATVALMSLLGMSE